MQPAALECADRCRPGAPCAAPLVFFSAAASVATHSVPGGAPGGRRVGQRRSACVRVHPAQRLARASAVLDPGPHWWQQQRSLLASMQRPSLQTTAAADEECCPAEEHDTEIVKTGSVAISSAEMFLATFS
jgi:hypothetical protein